jgi:Fe-S oxidoreductase
VHQPGWRSWNERTDLRTHEPVLGDTPVGQETVRDWAAGLDIPIGGETVLFVDCEAAFYRTSVPRAVAQMLQLAGYEFGLMGEQWCCGGPAAEMGYVEQAQRFARHNLDNWRSTGTKRVLVLDPHDYISFTEDYPKYFGEEYDIEVVLVLDVLAGLLREGRLTPSVPVDRAVSYHDPCRLNKRKGIWEEPREILRAIPGLTFHDVDRVTQWSYCSGGGGGLPIEKPDLTARISALRMERAADLDIDTLVSACPWSERPLSEAGDAQDIDVIDLHELLATSLGIEVGGTRGPVGDQRLAQERSGVVGRERRTRGSATGNGGCRGTGCSCGGR